METLCNICADNKKSNKIIICYKCKGEACRDCVQRYLIDETIGDAQCMYCRISWDISFQQVNFSSKFINIDFKEHRKNTLLAREKAYLASMMDLLFESKFNNLKKSVKSQLLKLRKEANKSFHDIDHCKGCRGELELNEYIYENIGKISEDCEFVKLKTRIAILECQLDTLVLATNDEMVASVFEQRKSKLTTDMTVETDKDAKHKFIRKCPLPDCIGYLSSQYKCGLCEKKVCRVCYAEDSATHVCKPEDIANKLFLTSSISTCPRCGVYIEKAFGCNSMWCIICKTAYNYKTGKILRGAFHNPERVVTEHAHIQNENVQHINLNQDATQKIQVPRIELTHHDELDVIYHDIKHYEAKIKNIKNDNSTEQKLIDLRLKFLKKQINEEDWKTQILRLDKKYTYNQYYYKIIDKYVKNSFKLINDSKSANPKKVKDIKEKYLELITKYNEFIRNLLEVYKYSVTQDDTYIRPPIYNNPKRSRDLIQSEIYQEYLARRAANSNE